MRMKIETVYYENYDDIVHYYPRLKELKMHSENEKTYIEINNLEDLQKIQQLANNNSLIIDFEFKNIEIYDTYRE